MINYSLYELNKFNILVFKYCIVNIIDYLIYINVNIRYMINLILNEFK